MIADDSADPGLVAAEMLGQAEHDILPTSRSARDTGGLWVGKFLKTVTYQRMSRGASMEIGEVERMPAHGLTARRRLEKFG